MNKRKSGNAFHLLLASIMTVSIVIIAVFLNSMSISTMVPAIALINADYQIESAMIMQMQKSHNNPLEKLRTLDKEIMPGVFLHLDSNSADGEVWNFKASIKGHGIERFVAAKASAQRPDRLIFLTEN